MRHSQVFDDPSGRRWKYFVRAAIAVGVSAFLLVAVLFASIFVVPALPADPHVTERLREALEPAPSLPRVATRRVERRAPRDPALQRLLTRIDGTERHPRSTSPALERAPVVAAFYAPWQ